MARIQFSKSDNTKGVITVTLGRGVLGEGGIGSETFYVKVSTSTKNAEGASIPDQYITSFSESFNDDVNEVITDILQQVTGSTLSSSSSSSESESSSST
jgi:hypothetical protein